MKDNEMLELLLTAEVLSLAKQIKLSKNTTSDCISYAVKEIRQKRYKVISELKNEPK